MSIARALTVRLRRHGASPSITSSDAHPMPKRAGTVLDRSKISSPVELISSTNMLSYEAPDVATIREMRQAEAEASASSSDDSSAEDDSSSSDNNDSSSDDLRISTEDLTDASSVDNSPSDTPEPNHLSCYFEAAQHDETKRSSTRISIRRSASSSRASPITRARSPDPLAPAIPARALSHSKSSHLALARKRSLQSLASGRATPSTGISRSNSQRLSTASAASTSAEPATASPTTTPGATKNTTYLHPFGRELEKLSEVVEELSGVMRDAEDEDDVAVMLAQGLSRWTAEQYLDELKPLYTTGFGAAGENHPTGTVPAWI